MQKYLILTIVCLPLFSNQTPHAIARAPRAIITETDAALDTATHIFVSGARLTVALPCICSAITCYSLAECSNNSVIKTCAIISRCIANRIQGN